MTNHDFQGKQDFICPAKRKIDLRSLKGQLYEKMENMEREHIKDKSSLSTTKQNYA